MLFLQMVPLVMPLLQTLTEQEADNFGIFLREILQSVMGWWVSQRNNMQTQSFCLKWKCLRLCQLDDRPRSFFELKGWGAIACSAMLAQYPQDVTSLHCTPPPDTQAMFRGSQTPYMQRGELCAHA